jgi:hypothetical protein
MISLEVLLKNEILDLVRMEPNNPRRNELLRQLSDEISYRIIETLKQAASKSFIYALNIQSPPDERKITIE